MGRVWEWLICTVRKVFRGVLNMQVKLSDDSLSTIFYEVESVVNSCPITKASNGVSDGSAESFASLERIPCTGTRAV